MTVGRFDANHNTSCENGNLELGFNILLEMNFWCKRIPLARGCFASFSVLKVNKTNPLVCYTQLRTQFRVNSFADCMRCEGIRGVLCLWLLLLKMMT